MIKFERTQSSVNMVKIKDIIAYLETLAPPALQESYDNAGLITGDRDRELTGALVTIDCTEAVVAEAVRKNCNLIIAHHPVIFRGIKSLTGKNYVERTVIKAIKNDIAIYAIHTNLDSVRHGVNKKLADKLGLTGTKILRPATGTLLKLTTFIPKENTEKVMEALHAAGAGMIGNYKNCSFRLEGTGTFLPTGDAQPAIGEVGALEKVNETRVEVILPEHLKDRVLQALFDAHPYEEVAYYLHKLINYDNETGAGMTGVLPRPMKTEAFLAKVKKVLSAGVIRHTAPVKETVSKVALCGGTGSFLLKDAIQAGADVFISADFKYHEFFDAEEKIIIADVGHYESEQFTKELIYEFLKENFANIALHFSDVNTNPILYA